LIAGAHPSLERAMKILLLVTLVSVAASLSWLAGG
jgi:hypothetical protein